MMRQLKVLIIEDDFRVAEINRQLVEQVEGFEVAAIAKTGDEAIALLENAQELPDLILLDVFIPDRKGLELFWEIRRRFRTPRIIMLTAAKEVATVEEALSGGVFDYIIKPADFSRFERSLVRFREQKALFVSTEELEQGDIDRLFGVRASAKAAAEEERDFLPKGIDQLTLQGVLEILKESAAEGVNAMEVGQAVGVSRSTARRYLEYLVSSNEAKAKLNYGEIGRPERRYIPWTK